MRELDRLLGLVAEHIDLEHCGMVDARYRAALAYERVDRPPLAVQPAFGAKISLPPPWDGFTHYGYRETFDDPEKMLQNHLLERVVPGLLIKDDNPLAIRNNHGTIQVAGILGGNWQLHEDNYPWVEPFGSMEKLEAIASSNVPVTREDGVLPQSLGTLRFYREKLAEYPPCAEAIQISLPDLQGPIDTAEQLWGSSIYYAFADTPGLFERLLSRITDVALQTSVFFREYATDRLDPFANTQHGYVIPGRILIRNDSSIMLSPDMYAQYVRPHDARLLREIGTGSIHFCGKGQHLVESMLEIADLRGLDFGESHLNDVKWIYERCRERRVVCTNIKPSRDDLMSGKARRDYPTGVVLVYNAESIEDGAEVAGSYYRR